MSNTEGDKHEKALSNAVYAADALRLLQNRVEYMMTDFVRIIIPDIQMLRSKENSDTKIYATYNAYSKRLMKAIVAFEKEMDTPKLSEKVKQLLIGIEASDELKKEVEACKLKLSLQQKK